MCWPKVEEEELGFQGKKQCRKKEAVNETEGKWKVESVYWMGIKPCFCEWLCSHWDVRFCHSAAGFHWRGCGLASRVCHHLKSQVIPMTEHAKDVKIQIQNL